MGDLTEPTEQQHDKSKENNESIPKLPWWKALRRASNESNKSTGPKRQQSTAPRPPVSEICIPTHCLENVSESPQDYFDRRLQQRGYSTQRTRVDPAMADMVHQGRNEAHRAMADNHWKAVHAVLSRTELGPQLLLQTDHTGRTPLMYAEPEDWVVWLQFLDASILDRYWPDPNVSHHEEEEDEDSTSDDYSDVGSVGSAVQRACHEQGGAAALLIMDDSWTSLDGAQDQCAIMDKKTEKDRRPLQEETKNVDDEQLRQEYFQAALEARG